MDEDHHSGPEESITLPSQFWFWKKNNSVSAATKCQRKTEAWLPAVTPSVFEDSVRTDPETKPPTTIHSLVPLPGSVINYSEEIQEPPSCVIKSTVIEDTPKEDDGEGNTWLHKFGIHINKWSILNSLVGWSENRALGKVDHLDVSGVCSDANYKAIELEECATKEEVPYIPYKLATSYIIKVVKDMQQMKKNHMRIIRQLDNTRKEMQEQRIAAIKKHYGEKMRSFKCQLEGYRELMSKSNTHLQDTIKGLRERNRQLIQEKENLLQQMRQQTEKWEEEKVWIQENLHKNIDYLYMQHTLTLQELHSISLYAKRTHDLMNFQIKEFQQKPEKAEGEKEDVSVVLQLKKEQVANEEEKPERSMEKGYFWEACTILQMIQLSLQRREREVTEILQRGRRYNKATKPQIAVLEFMKTFVKKVHTIYCDVPEAQQYISQLIRKNEDEKAEKAVWKEVFNNAQADTLTHEVFNGKEPLGEKRTQLSMQIFRNLGNAKSELEYVETEKIVFDCIQTGKIPSWIKRDCLYVDLTEDPATCSEETAPPSRQSLAEV